MEYHRPSRLAPRTVGEPPISQFLLLCALALQQLAIPHPSTLGHHCVAKTRLAPPTGSRNSFRPDRPQSPQSHLLAAPLHQDVSRFLRLCYRPQNPRIAYPALQRRPRLPKKRHTTLSRACLLKIAHHRRWARAIVGPNGSSTESHRCTGEPLMGDVTTDWMMRNHNPAEDGL